MLPNFWLSLYSTLDEEVAKNIQKNKEFSKIKKKFYQKYFNYFPINKIMSQKQF